MWSHFYYVTMSKANILSFFTILEGRAKKTGLYPVCLVVYYNGAKKRYRMKVEVSKEQWKKINAPKLRDEELKGKRDEIQSFLKKAEKSAKQLSEFNFEEFEQVFFKSKDKKTKGLSFDECTRELMEGHSQDWSLKTAIMYQTILNSVNAYKKDLKLKDITPEFIREYEKRLTSQGKSISTVGIYLRQIRAICNYAIMKNYLVPEKSPFKHYSVPAAQKNKRALSNEEIKTLLDYNASNREEQKALDFWIFSYLGNGINFNDIAKLKYSNIQGDKISFIRTKTKNKNRSNLKEINIYLLPRLKEVIDRWGVPHISDNDYIFPILHESMTDKDQYNAIAQFIKTTNKYLKRISSDLKLAEPITTYYARHSFATRLKRAGASIEYISESLGHSNISTTEVYLSGFTDETIKENANLLINL